MAHNSHIKVPVLVESKRPDYGVHDPMRFITKRATAKQGAIYPVVSRALRIQNRGT